MSVPSLSCKDTHWDFYGLGDYMSYSALDSPSLFLLLSGIATDITAFPSQKSLFGQ